MLDVSIILPTYNEQANVIALLKAIDRVMRPLKKHYEIIVVDDNSPDGTGNLAKAYALTHPEVKVFVRKTDLGLGKAIGYGVKRTKGEIIVGMDADFNHPPESIPLLLKVVAPKTLVLASRFIKGGGMVEKPRYWLTWGFNLVLQALGFPSTDNASGFNAIYRKDLIVLPLDEIYYGYGDYHLRLVYKAKQSGYQIREVPVQYGKRQGGVSKSQLGKMAFEYLREAWRLKSSQ